MNQQTVLKGINGQPCRSAASTGVLHCEVARNPQQVQELADAWRQLQKQGGRDNQGFQTLQWNTAWMQAFLCAGAAGAVHIEPYVIMICDGQDGTPQLLWPLMRETYPLGMSVISWMSDPFAQYGDVITTLSGEPLQTALQMALNILKQEQVDLIRLRFVREDAAIAPFLRQFFMKSTEDCAAPWLNLTEFASLEELDKRFNREQRRRRRKIRKKIRQQLGAEPALRLMREAAEIRAAIGVLLDCKRQWLKNKGLVSRALFDGHTQAFLMALTDTMPPWTANAADDDNPQLALSVMEVQGRQLSWEIGFRYRGRHYAYITAHVPELTHLSLGRLHMDMLQKQTWQHGLKIYDLLVPDAPHKRTWSTHKTSVSSYYLPLSLRGRLLGQAYLNHLRPFMRKVYHRMPSQWRRLLRLSDMVGHEYSIH